MATRYIFIFLLKRIWLVAIITIVAGGIAYLLLRTQGDGKYSSTAQLYVGSASVAKSSSDGESGGGSNALSEHVKNMRREPITSTVAYSLLLHDLEEETPFRDVGTLPFSTFEKDSARKILERKISSFKMITAENRVTDKINQVLGDKDYDLSKWHIQGDLSIHGIKNSNIINVEFRSENPFLSAFVVNTLCAEYMRYSDGGTPVRQNAWQFVGHVRERKEVLDSIDAERRKYQSTDQRPATDGEDQEELRRQYEQELRVAEREQRSVGRSLEEVKAKLSNEQKPKPVNDSEKKRKLAALETKVNDLEKIYADNGSKDKELASTIHSLRRQWQQLQAEFEKEEKQSSTGTEEIQHLKEERDRLELAYRNTARKISAARSRLNGLRNNASSPRQTTNDSALASLDVQYNKALEEYRAAMEKFGGEQEALSGRNSDMKVVEIGQASAEPEPTGYEKLVWITAAVAAVLSIVCIIIAARNQLNRNEVNPWFTVSR